MTIRSAVFIAVLAAAGVAASAASAQTWAPPHEIAGAAPVPAAASPAPEPAKPAPIAAAAATGAEKPAAGPEDKKAKSKDCSAQADAKGLHGKERKKFREACKKA